MANAQAKSGKSPRDIGIIVFAIVAVAVAVFVIYHTWAAGQPHIVASINLAGQGPKSAWLAQQKKGSAPATGTETNGQMRQPGN